MSGNAVTEFTSVQSQYEAQVAADLESNTAAQKRLRAEVESLQAQLATLEHDHTLLLGVQRVFADGAGPGRARGAKVPGARAAKRPAKAPAGAAEAPKSAKVSARAAAGRARKRAKAPAKSAAAATAATADTGATAATGTVAKQPSLAQLVGTLLAAHGEPRSAAEVSAELAADHPRRNSNINVVRNALEQLVAKSEALRAKQKKSVFYTHAGRDGATVPAQPADAAPAAG